MTVQLYWHETSRRIVCRKTTTKPLGLDFSDDMKNFLSKCIWSVVKKSVLSSPT